MNLHTNSHRKHIMLKYQTVLCALFIRLRLETERVMCLTARVCVCVPSWPSRAKRPDRVMWNKRQTILLSPVKGDTLCGYDNTRIPRRSRCDLMAGETIFYRTNPVINNLKVATMIQYLFYRMEKKTTHKTWKS